MQHPIPEPLHFLHPKAGGPTWQQGIKVLLPAERHGDLVIYSEFQRGPDVVRWDAVRCMSVQLRPGFLCFNALQVGVAGHAHLDLPLCLTPLHLHLLRNIIKSASAATHHHLQVRCPVPQLGTLQSGYCLHITPAADTGVTLSTACVRQSRTACSRSKAAGILGVTSSRLWVL